VKQSVEVEIAGQKLVIRSDEGPGYVQELADYVDVQLRSMGGDRRSTFNVQRAALLVAIQIADELFREKDLHQQLRRRVSANLDALEAALGEHEQQIERLAATAGDGPDLADTP
jgi:cell division protein ZapA